MMTRRIAIQLAFMDKDGNVFHRLWRTSADGMGGPILTFELEDAAYVFATSWIHQTHAIGWSLINFTGDPLL